MVDRVKHPAVPDRYDHGEGRLGLYPAGHAAPPDPPEEQNPITSNVADLLRFDLEAIEVSPIGMPKPPNSLVAAIDALRPLDQALEHRMPLDGRVYSSHEPFEVVPLPSLKVAPHNVHVLLRHRPRSIPRLSSRRERLAPTAPRLRGPPRGSRNTR